MFIIFETTKLLFNKTNGLSSQHSFILYLEPSQTSTIDSFCKKILGAPLLFLFSNLFKLLLLTDKTCLLTLFNHYAT